jgi:EAL domain-containing protein (putative c-di-GMP-specific phosphodiesterase class I)
MHLHYQIQVDNNNRPQGAEAFLRWKHPEHGVFMPGQFLPIAEESDVIIKISRWVLQSACQQLALWGRDDKTRNLTLTINISAKHFGLPGFVDEVADILKTYQADPTHLKMELSEKLVLTEINSTKDKIHALRNLGVKVAMDNFSTVYSSLSFIKELSSDQLKIHQEFVQGITKEGGDAKLVQTIIDLAKSLELDVFAEGVETEAQRTFLEKHDCNLYQGYLFGKPISIEEFDAVIAKL